jgi:hypothetical protein
MTLPAAAALAQEILDVARKAHSEEDVRIGVEKALGAVLQNLQLHLAPEYEKTTLSGSADAVYGHVVIEYKALPSSWPSKSASICSTWRASPAAQPGRPRP